VWHCAHGALVGTGFAGRSPAAPNELVSWHTPQFSVVGCLASSVALGRESPAAVLVLGCIPRKAAVSWQLAQVSAVTARWLIFVPAQVVKLVVEWQPSHGVGGVPTGIWVGGMPVADTPLWQLAQLLVTPTWLNIAPPQLSVV